MGVVCGGQWAFGVVKRRPTIVGVSLNSFFGGPFLEFRTLSLFFLFDIPRNTCGPQAVDDLAFVDPPPLWAATFYIAVR